jgi:hypothetical protein
MGCDLGFNNDPHFNGGTIGDSLSRSSIDSERVDEIKRRIETDYPRQDVGPDIWADPPSGIISKHGEVPLRRYGEIPRLECLGLRGAGATNKCGD